LDFQKDANGVPNMNAELSMKLGWNLGYQRPIYEGAIVYTADTIIEPATIRYLFLAIDDYHNSGNNHFLSAFQKSFLNPNILARITIKGAYFTLVMENDLSIVTEPRKYFGPVDIQKLRIRLFDEHGRIIDTNGANFSMCLNFKVMYDL
jgi:cystathionine beta-lyase family protein involved in aluminum resistance